MNRQLTRAELRKIIVETVQADQVNEDWMSDLIPDVVKDMYSDLKSDVREEIKTYIKDEVSNYLKDNAKSLSENAPYGTQGIVADLISNTHNAMGDCAGEVAVKYIGSKVP